MENCRLKLPINQIINNDALAALRTLPSESIDCCITSPPYWALRDYNTKPQVWDSDKNCDHQWGEKIPPRGHKSGKPGPNATVGARFAQDATRRGKGSDFCTKCGAWRGNLGLEPDFNLYIKHLCDIFDEIKRVLKKAGSCWIVIGDTYGGSGGAAGHTETTKNLGYTTSKMGATKGITQNLMPKCLLMIPERFAIEMISRGWILRSKIIWHKPNCMPSSTSDRFTIDFEYFFFFTKSQKYHFEQQFENFAESTLLGKPTRDRKNGSAFVDGTPGRKKQDGGKIVMPNPKGRNKRCVWTITTKPYGGAHFAVFPEALIETPIKAGCPKNGIVMDPFLGSGTTAVVAKKLNRNWLGIELNPSYIKLAEKRIANAERTML